MLVKIVVADMIDHGFKEPRLRYAEKFRHLFELVSSVLFDAQRVRDWISPRPIGNSRRCHTPKIYMRIDAGR